MNGSEALPNEESPPELDDDAALEAAAEEIEQDISSIAQQRDEYLALAQRLQAEFENYKNRRRVRNPEVIENRAFGLGKSCCRCSTRSTTRSSTASKASARCTR